MSVIIRLKAGREKLTIAPYTLCRLLDGGLEGFEAPPAINGTMLPSALGDGGILIGRCFAGREISVFFEITDREAYQEIHDKIMRLMTFDGEVTVTADVFGRRRSIKAFAVGRAEFIRENENTFPRVKLKFICPDPFFTEGKAERFTLPLSVGLLTFPLNLMEGAGGVPSFADSGTVHKIYNPGDVACGFKLTIRAVGGSVTDPAVLLNNRRLQLMETLADGDVLVFDTHKGSCGVSVNGVSRYNFDKQSNFFALEAGENKLTVMSVGDSRNISAEIEFTPFYAGA